LHRLVDGKEMGGQGTAQHFAKDEAVYLPQGCITGWQTVAGTRLLVSSYLS
jgi:hypothetical protein